MQTVAAARSVSRAVLLSAVIAGVTLLALSVQPRGAVSVIYPAAGLAFAMVWMEGPAALLIVALVHVFISARSAGTWTVPVAVGAIETFVAATLASILRRNHVDRELSGSRDVAIFAGAALGVTFAGGALAAIGQWLLESPGTAVVARDATSYWLSDFVSILVFTPLVTTWRRWRVLTPLRFRRWLLVSTLLLVLGGAIAFAGASAATALFLLLPIVVLISIIAGSAGAASSGAILLLVLLVLELRHPGGSFDPLVRTVFTGVAAATGYALAALWNEKEQSAMRLEYLARHDTLTGLWNRYALETHLAAALAGSQPSQALLYLDLDQFKLVNDTCGHVAGDRMLEQLAVELKRAVPPDAILARLGGDEFACILPQSNADHARRVANDLRRAVDAFRFHVDSMTFAVSVSIGITLFPGGDGDSPHAILSRADVACFAAKEEGRRRAHLYLADDEAMLRRHSAIQEVSQFELALSEGRFTLYAQPIFDLDRRQEPATFFEILLRLTDGKTVRSPVDFLPIAEQYGLMPQLDRWVFDTACAHLASISNRSIRITINVSGLTVSDPAFIAHVLDAPQRFGIAPEQICLEVTESVMIHRLRATAEALGTLRSVGIRLALDDFGAGVASFAYLQELPVTHVKLDGRFVRDLSRDAASEIIVEALTSLAALRGIICVAEGVESEDVVGPLQRLGVRYAQGFHLCRPIPLHDALPLDAVTPKVRTAS